MIKVLKAKTMNKGALILAKEAEDGEKEE